MNIPLLYVNNDIKLLHLTHTGEVSPVEGFNPLGTSTEYTYALDELTLFIRLACSSSSILLKPYPKIQSTM